MTHSITLRPTIIKEAYAVKRIIIALIIIMVFFTVTWAQMRGMMRGGMHDISPMQYQQERFSEEMHISRGGQLYDDWWRTTVDTVKPGEDHPLWKMQTTNKRRGYATYRCKECHGWDYRGKDGAYSKGSHYTGFKGVLQSAEKMSLKELEAVLKGFTNKEHDFSKYVNDEDIADLALFMKKGLTDTNKLVSSDGIPVKGDPNAGRIIFMNTCMHMCHGGVGTMINFGDSEKPEFVGTVANENPWEFIHKVRAGQPGTRMPSAIINKWSEEDINDLLTFARTLPVEAQKISMFRRMMVRMGFGMCHHESYIPVKYRGYGPIIGELGM